REGVAMGSRGPVPKREEQRVRRNKDDVPVEKVTAIGPVEAPPLDIENPHPLVIDFYDSLPESAETQYWEPSDWQWARVTCHFLSKTLWDKRPSAQMLQVIQTSMSDLLVTEGARRRVRMEIERNQAQAEVIDVAALFRE